MNNNKTMHNDSMDSMSMMSNSFFGEVTPQNEEKISKECAFMGLVKNHIIRIDDQIKEADSRFSEAYHHEKYSQATYEADEKWKMLKAKKDALIDLQKDMENMITPSEKPLAMSA